MDTRTDEQLKEESLECARMLLLHQDGPMYYIYLGQIAAVSMLIHERTRAGTWSLD